MIQIERSVFFSRISAPLFFFFSHFRQCLKELRAEKALLLPEWDPSMPLPPPPLLLPLTLALDPQVLHRGRSSWLFSASRFIRSRSCCWDTSS